MEASKCRVEVKERDSMKVPRTDLNKSGVAVGPRKENPVDMALTPKANVSPPLNAHPLLATGAGSVLGKVFMVGDAKMVHALMAPAAELLRRASPY